MKLVDKNLNTALASWAELKHDTILYGKQSGAECGDGYEVSRICEPILKYMKIIVVN